MFSRGLQTQKALNLILAVSGLNEMLLEKWFL